MKKIESALLLYPHQLFATEHLPKVDIIYVIEDPLFFGTDQEYPVAFHKQKLVLHRASMRRYTEEQLWAHEIDVEYIELADVVSSGEVLSHAQKAGASLVYMFDPSDSRLEKRLQDALSTNIVSPFELRVLPTPMFMLRRGEVEDFFTNKSNHSFAPFYQWQRERFNILLDKKYKPVGGMWMLDENSTKSDTTQPAPGFASFGDNNYVKEAISWVQKRFADNPGSLESFVWPTNHQEATMWLQDFLTHRLEHYAQFEHALDSDAMVLYHSGASALINTGLLTPTQIVQAATAQQQKALVPLPSLEHFLRYVIGWREYVRGLYVTQGDELRARNTFEHTNTLSSAWWDGSTGLPPLDDVIQKVLNHAYTYGSERTHILASSMLLCDISPNEAYQWNMSMFIDAYDWVVVPNVYGIGQCDDCGGMVPETCLMTSNGLISNSNYQKEDWCDTWDGLLWRFVANNQDVLSQNSRTASLVKTYKRLNEDRKRIISYRAQDFLNSL